jgi:hypothetical protein
MADEMISVPRPNPDQFVIAICGEDGARAWVTAKTATLLEADWTQLLPGLLAEAQQRLRDEYPKHGEHGDAG